MSIQPSPGVGFGLDDDHFTMVMKRAGAKALKWSPPGKPTAMDDFLVDEYWASFAPENIESDVGRIGIGVHPKGGRCVLINRKDGTARLVRDPRHHPRPSVGLSR